MLLSVIIPAYNCEKYIEQCVYSVINQPCSKEIQIVAVDDGSPDNCGKILDEIAKKHSNVMVIHKENGGLSSARNAGIEKAEGKYMQFLDADDFLEANFFDEDIIELLSQEYDLYGFSYKHIVGNKYYKISRVKTELKIFDPNKKGKCDYHTSWTYLFRREIVQEKKILFPDGVVSNEDMLFLEKYFYFTKSYYCYDKVMYNYRKNEESITHTIKWAKQAELELKCFTMIGEWFNSIGEEFNLDSCIGMVFSEVVDTVCYENSYDFCKNFIDNHPEFECVKNYKNIQIPPYYYPKVKHYMKHTLLFWTSRKLKYKLVNLLEYIAKKYPKMNDLYKYILYIIIRKYRIEEKKSPV